MDDFMIFGALILGIIYIFFVIEPKTVTENKVRLLHETTEMIKALDNSKLSEDDKEKAKDAITEAAKAIIKNNESER